MRSIIESCRPRDGVLEGTFNPEIFTASLSQVISHYRGRSGHIDNLYTAAVPFFRDGTAPTEGLKFVLREALLRLSGDNSAPAIYRLETAFGGGKTHTLIALTHLALRGNELGEVAAPLFDGTPLPARGECAVAGVAGDELPVHRPEGPEPIPYTLWGEIAFQIGGAALYQAIGQDATATAAPGSAYFETVFKGRKALVLLDELAQYAARLEAARANGAEQLAAFLLALHGYARTHSGLVVVVTLASASDAFARQTQRIVELLSQVRGAPVGAAEAEAIAQRAARDAQSVAARDATPVVPVQAAELSRVLAKRLFAAIDADAAQRPPVRMASCTRAARRPCPTRRCGPITATASSRTTRSIRRFCSFSTASSRRSKPSRERAGFCASWRSSSGTSGRSGTASRWCTPRMSICAIRGSSTKFSAAPARAN